MKNKRIMIVDALNMYFRAYIVDPSLSANGQPIGGVKGFLKILQKLTREIKPDHIVVAWDGGSSRRRSTFGGYKSGRKPIRLNRGIRNMTENEELENKIWQQTRLFEYLNEMPVCQLMIDNLEADDIIAFVANLKEIEDWQKVIVSSDKDFIQLCSDKTILYRPVQNEILNEKRIIESYGIHPNNFALARSMAGDKSDNLPGVGGVGLPTVSKRFPFLSEDKDYTIADVVEYAASVDSKLKAYQNVVEKQDLIEQNYRLMQLYMPSISPQSKSSIKSCILDFEPEFNKTGTKAMMIEDGFGVYDWNDLFVHFRKIIVEHKGES